MTTYPTSTAPAAKVWLFGQMQTLLAADPDATFEVSYATEEDTLNSPDDQVWLGPVANRVVKGFAMVGGQGQYSTAEDYDLTGTITCYRAGDSGAAAEARAWALLGVVETAQRTDPTMGGLVVTSRPNQSGSDVDWDEEGNGRICVLEFSFHCFAVI